VGIAVFIGDSIVNGGFRVSAIGKTGLSDLKKKYNGEGVPRKEKHAA
jgi:hypothetical protein